MGVTPLELFGLDPRRGIPAWIAEDYLLLMEEQGKLADLRDQQERLRIAGERQRSSRR